MSVIKENISSTFALFNRIVYYLFDKIKIIIFEGWSNNEKLKLNTFILGLHLNSFYYYSLNMYFIFFIVLRLLIISYFILFIFYIFGLYFLFYLYIYFCLLITELNLFVNYDFNNISSLFIDLEPYLSSDGLLMNVFDYFYSFYLKICNFLLLLIFSVYTFLSNKNCRT